MKSQAARPLGPTPEPENPRASFAHVGRYSSWTFVVLDLLGTLVWQTLVLRHDPSARALKVGLTIGVVGVLADAGYWYGVRRSRTVEIADGCGGYSPVPRWDPKYVGVWLVFWLDLVIGTNIGTWIGLMFVEKLDLFSVWTAGFMGWYLAVGLLAKVIHLPGDVTIRATRLMGTGIRTTSLILPAVAYTAMGALGMLGMGEIGRMILVGLVASFTMELPLYALGWRHPPGHLTAPVANTICEWSGVVPLLYLAFLGFSGGG